MKKLFAILLLALACSAPAQADKLQIIRAPQSYPEAMSTLQAAISSRGYKITRVQNIDVGISKTGHTIDYYKVVFYGNLEETAGLARKHPELIPYLPLNIVIFAEDSNTVVTAVRPTVFAEFFPDPELKPIFERWEKDLLAILDEVREAK
ncbi:MAG: DUF302 domain-containing protein [Sulfuricella sp.]|nr:DUF302 domain-containing protein [Sulfuricella sp.]